MLAMQQGKQPIKGDTLARGLTVDNVLQGQPADGEIRDLIQKEIDKQAKIYAGQVYTPKEMINIRRGVGKAVGSANWANSQADEAAVMVKKSLYMTMREAEVWRAVNPTRYDNLLSKQSALIDFRNAMASSKFTGKVFDPGDIVAGLVFAGGVLSSFNPMGMMMSTAAGAATGAAGRTTLVSTLNSSFTGMMGDKFTGAMAQHISRWMAETGSSPTKEVVEEAYRKSLGEAPIISPEAQKLKDSVSTGAEHVKNKFKKPNQE